tara:strand:+ start:129 stop:290 length:162 start_codon:yes stop_codon:yes gene_type:complete
MKDNNRYKVCWISEPIVNGFYSQHEAVVFGLDSVQHIIENVVPKDQGWDVIPM